MLNLSSTEVKIIRAWSEKAESSPFPQEQTFIRRLKQNAANRSMQVSRREIDLILHWAENETRGHYGHEQYLLEMEAALIGKLEKSLNG